MLEPYAKALYLLAKEEGISKKVYDDLKRLDNAFSENPTYLQIISSPKIKEKTQIIDEDFADKVNRHTLNFLKVLCEKRAVGTFHKCVKEYERLYNSDNNIRFVRVITARELAPSLEEKLINKLNKKYGTIILEKSIDCEIIGGMIIEADGKRLDYSIKSRLEDMKEALKRE